jgi:hypothetical protein
MVEVRKDHRGTAISVAANAAPLPATPRHAGRDNRYGRFSAAPAHHGVIDTKRWKSHAGRRLC